MDRKEHEIYVNAIRYVSNVFLCKFQIICKRNPNKFDQFTPGTTAIIRPLKGSAHLWFVTAADGYYPL